MQPIPCSRECQHARHCSKVTMHIASRRRNWPIGNNIIIHMTGNTYCITMSLVGRTDLRPQLQENIGLCITVNLVKLELLFAEIFMLTDKHTDTLTVQFTIYFISSRCNIYISHLCHDASPSVRLSVTEVHWRIIANLGFKFRSHFTAHCGRRAACSRRAARRAACGRIISRHASQC